MEQNKIAIFDLDNCISDDGWRIPMIKWSEKSPDDRYRVYHKKARYDEFCNRAVLREHQRLGRKIAILTARPAEFSDITFRWLFRNDIHPEQVYFRPENDHRHSKELKEHQLGLLVDYCEANNLKIDVAYDDREDVVQMYKSNGIDGSILKIHNICAYTAPNGA